MTDDTMIWTEERWAAFTAALAARLRERFGEGELLPVDDRNHHELRGEAPALYICCYEEARPWEGAEPTLSEDGTATLEHDPDIDNPNPGTED